MWFVHKRTPGYMIKYVNEMRSPIHKGYYPHMFITNVLVKRDNCILHFSTVTCGTGMSGPANQQGLFEGVGLENRPERRVNQPKMEKEISKFYVYFDENKMLCVCCKNYSAPQIYRTLC